MLQHAYGWSAYSVTNLGDSGSTMLKKGNKPYWQGPRFKALTSAKWDLVIIMLGTNDAKDSNPLALNWKHDCGGVNHTTLDGCSFATDYAAMIELVKTLGTKDSGPDIYVMIPPPLMQHGAYTMNQTVI